MKNNIMKTMGKMMIALLLVAGMVSGCSKEDRIENTIQRGTWMITLFQEDDDIETSKFSGYRFDFDDDGDLTATNGSRIVTGTWSTNGDKFFIDFGNGDPFEELNEDWRILERDNHLLRLQHISGGNGGIDWVTFERI